MFEVESGIGEAVVERVVFVADSEHPPGTNYFGHCLNIFVMAFCTSC
jgi:hypothetical protein